jgi:serine/threonine protein kinase
MSGSCRIDRSAACSTRFAAHHRVETATNGTTLRLGRKVGAGGFATVFTVESIDGKPPSRPLLAKVFHDSALSAVPGGAQRIAKGIGALIDKLEQLPADRWCYELLALPYCVAFARWKGRSALVALMLDLGALGYEACPLGDTDELKRYLARTVDERQELARAFAEKAALLEEVGLVHADLNRENLLVRYTPPDVQVLDVDAGVLIERGDERPLTPGKTDGFMPPEIKQPDAPGQIDLDAYVPAAERWSIGCLVGYLLFAAHPVFYLEEISAASIAAYATERPGWPVIDQRSPLFTTADENRVAYPNMLSLFEDVPTEVGRTFQKLFFAGPDADSRPTASEWCEALSTMRTPPELIDLQLDAACVLAGMSVTLSWQTKRAAAVEVWLTEAGRSPRLLGSVPTTGSLALPLERDSSIELVARNSYGEVRQVAGTVCVLPMPAITRYRIPRPRPAVSRSTVSGAPACARFSLARWSPTKACWRPCANARPARPAPRALGLTPASPAPPSVFLQRSLMEVFK